uniref:Uncharacterized protein n=1 Tax=viral metagenome TaxID=1070528 RepID=A0A6C0AFP2_9ZZZZ
MKIKEIFLIKYNSVPDKKEHFFINSYKNIYKFFKLDKLIWDGVVQHILNDNNLDNIDSFMDLVYEFEQI